MARSLPPTLDDGVRRRLTARFGDAVESWFAGLPPVLTALADRWYLDLGAPIPRGSMSVVIRCRLPDRRPAVLKISPDRARVASEAAALRNWATAHVPSVVAVDESVGALLIEAIEPGVSLVESPDYPDLALVADLLIALHAERPSGSYPSVAERVAYLFDSWTGPRERNPGLVELVPPELFERGRRLALRLAQAGPPTVLLHGDLNPGNILDGGGERGLVAIDPAPCLGDGAFDAMDVVFWQADDRGVIEARASRLGAAMGVGAARILDWCTAFAGMAALDLVGSPAYSPGRTRTVIELANEA